MLIYGKNPPATTPPPPSPGKSKNFKKAKIKKLKKHNTNIKIYIIFY